MYSPLISKSNFHLRENSNTGIILQVHNTALTKNGAPHRVPFVLSAFSEKSEVLACADRDGCLFIFDLRSLKIWKLGDIGEISCMKFVPHIADLNVLAVGVEYAVKFIDLETGDYLNTFKGDSSDVKHIEFSSAKIRRMATASTTEAIVWDMESEKMIFRLNSLIVNIIFSPALDNIVVLYRNDVIKMWQHENMKICKEIRVKHLKCVTFTVNGRAMVIGCSTPIIVLFCMDTLTVSNTVDLSKYGISGVKQLAFIPQTFDGGASNILAIRSNNCQLHIFDVEASNVIRTIHPDGSGVKDLTVCQNGKYFACLLKTGEINIYKYSLLLKKPFRKIFQSKKLESYKVWRAAVDEKSKSMSLERMQTMLIQSGEYPDEHRLLAWRSLLKTPNNADAFTALIKKPLHPNFNNLEKDFVIKSSSNLKSLKKILSCLAYWCPLFANVSFLPGFVFPFVRVLRKNPLFMFEVVASVLINYCQLWFEYSPFPPISVLAVIENLLTEHDPFLLKHLCASKVTSQTYALPLLETGFSEILTSGEWLTLWDHILTNEPAFILTVPVAYSILQRSALKKMKNLSSIEQFYRSQNPINMKLFLKHCYKILIRTSPSNQPGLFLKKYEPLPSGECYPPFEGCPQAELNIKVSKSLVIEDVKEEREMSLRELMRAEMLGRESEAEGSEPTTELCDSDEEIETIFNRE